MHPSNIIGLFVCIGSLSFAYFFLENYLHLVPCPLCILDRIVLACMALVFASSLFFHKVRRRVTMLVLNLAFLCFGFLFAGRHVWLQNRPLDPRTECLSDTPEIKGITEFLAKAFDAEADCALIAWHLFGLTIPGMTLGLFVGLLILLGMQGYGLHLEASEDDDGHN